MRLRESMPGATVADLPRLVRIDGEVRWRGQAALAIAVAVVLYWATAWYLEAPFETLPVLLVCAGTALLTAIAALLSTRRRVPEALEATRRPPPALYETRADARDRRSRLVLLVLFAVAALLVVDRVVDGGGAIAGLVVGLFAVLGAVDLVEARRWREAERARDSRLYILIPGRAMGGRYGRVEVYEAPGVRGHNGAVAGDASDLELWP
jgi:hypothetical protein